MEKKKKQNNETILIAAENVHSKSKELKAEMEGYCLIQRNSLYTSVLRASLMCLQLEHLCQLEDFPPLPGSYNYYKNKRKTCHSCSVHVWMWPKWRQNMCINK